MSESKVVIKNQQLVGSLRVLIILINISNCLILSFGTQGRSRMLKPFYQKQKWRTRKGFCTWECPTGSCLVWSTHTKNYKYLGNVMCLLILFWSPFHNIYIYQIIALYILNLHNVKCQLCFSKAGKNPTILQFTL